MIKFQIIKYFFLISIIFGVCNALFLSSKGTAAFNKLVHINQFIGKLILIRKFVGANSETQLKDMKAERERIKLYYKKYAPQCIDQQQDKSFNQKYETNPVRQDDVSPIQEYNFLSELNASEGLNSSNLSSTSSSLSQSQLEIPSQIKWPDSQSSFLRIDSIQQLQESLTNISPDKSQFESQLQYPNQLSTHSIRPFQQQQEPLSEESSNIYEFPSTIEQNMNVSNPNIEPISQQQQIINTQSYKNLSPLSNSDFSNASHSNLSTQPPLSSPAQTPLDIPLSLENQSNEQMSQLIRTLKTSNLDYKIVFPMLFELLEFFLRDNTNLKQRVLLLEHNAINSRLS